MAAIVVAARDHSPDGRLFQEFVAALSATIARRVIECTAPPGVAELQDIRVRSPAIEPTAEKYSPLGE